MLKILSAMAAAALIAGAVVTFFGAGEAVHAGTAGAAQKDHQLVTEQPVAATAPACVNRGWPYFDHGCQHGEAHPVRLVTTDRF